MSIRICLAALSALVLIGLGGSNVCADGEPSVGYSVVNTFKIGLDGRWDYATLDETGKALYLTRGTHTIVVDTATGNVIADIPGGAGLHGVALAPESGHGFITDGRGGSVIIFDIRTNAVLGTLAAADDADGTTYDPATKHVFVACGDANALVPIAGDVDPKTGKADAPIDLGGKPESLVADGKGKVFVDLADKAELAVVDAKSMKVLAKYSTGDGTGPTGLAMDRDNDVLFIGCRNRKMIVMSAKDGSILADLPIGRGVDAGGFSAVGGGTAFASCGDGTLTLVRQTSPGKYEVVQTVKTANGARTMAVDFHSGVAYLPTADMAASTNPSSNPGRPRAIPGTFKIVVVSPYPAPATQP